MKTKIVLFLAISALITLSFTFSSVGNNKESKIETKSKGLNEEPAGGFVSEDKF